MATADDVLSLMHHIVAQQDFTQTIVSKQNKNRVKQVYHKLPYWSETEEKEQRQKFKEWQKMEAQRCENRTCSENPGRPHGESPF